MIPRRSVQGSALRQTPQRRAVLEAIDRVGPHCTADELLVDLEARGADVCRSTVYRTLDTLGRAGLVREVHLGAGPARYERTDSEHQHALCRLCGTVFHLEHALLDDFERHIEEAHHFKALRMEVLVVGVCEACSQRPHSVATTPRFIEHSH